MAAQSPDIRQVTVAIQRLPADLEQRLQPELDASAHQFVAMARVRVAKWRTLLANSINVHATGPLEREMRPGVGYAQAVEEGVRPGGKGLPRFSDPASRSIVEWLRTRAFAGRRAVRANTMAAVRANLELRDRYEGLAWHIRHKGVKAQPFMAPTFERWEPVARLRLTAAAEAAVRDSGGTP